MSVEVSSPIKLNFATDKHGPRGAGTLLILFVSIRVYPWLKILTVLGRRRALMDD